MFEIYRRNDEDFHFDAISALTEITSEQMKDVTLSDESSVRQLNYLAMPWVYLFTYVFKSVVLVVIFRAWWWPQSSINYLKAENSTMYWPLKENVSSRSLSPQWMSMCNQKAEMSETAFTVLSQANDGRQTGKDIDKQKRLIPLFYFLI